MFYGISWPKKNPSAKNRWFHKEKQETIFCWLWFYRQGDSDPGDLLSNFENGLDNLKFSTEIYAKIRKKHTRTH